MDRKNRRPPFPVVSLVLALLPAACVSPVAAVGHECPMNVSEPVTGEARLVDGTLLTGNPERSYGASQFRFAANGSGFELCTCTLKPCVLKCCAGDEVWEDKCVKPNDDYVPQGSFAVPKLVTENGTVESFETDKFIVKHNKLKCIGNLDMYQLDPINYGKTDIFQVSENGTLLNEFGTLIAPPGQFCLEQSAATHYQLLPIACSVLDDLPEEFPVDKFFRLLNVIALLLSVPFLFLTFLVYALIGKLQNLHGKCLMCHVASLLVAFISLIIVEFKLGTVHDAFCVTIAHITQFSFLACFFWLSIMCFDFWNNLRGSAPGLRNSTENNSNIFFIYSMIAWGFPCLISIITYFMDYKFKGSSLIYPGFGEKNCWYRSTSASWLYFYGPILMLLLFNLVMFIYSAILIADHSLHGNLFRRPHHNINMEREKQKFTLYLKLFMVMGVNWLAEILPMIFERNTLRYLWIITDLANASQGIIIFIIFVCKKNVLKLVVQKYCSGYLHYCFTTVPNDTESSIESNRRDSEDHEINNPIELISDNVQNSSNLLKG